MELKKEPNKHLTYEERNFIEIGLNNGRNFLEIAKDLNKNRTTIMREVKKHRFKKIPSKFNNSGSLCQNRFECQKYNCSKKEECYKEEICYDLTGAPYVCNGCIYKQKCRKIKYYYYAKFANDDYSEKLKESRYGIDLSREEAYDLDQLILPLLKEKHQSIAHIYANHPNEISFSRTTMYNYINLGVFSARNINLPRKVKYKKRKENEKTAKKTRNSDTKRKNI